MKEECFPLVGSQPLQAGELWDAQGPFPDSSVWHSLLSWNEAAAASRSHRPVETEYLGSHSCLMLLSVPLGNKAYMKKECGKYIINHKYHVFKKANIWETSSEWRAKPQKYEVMGCPASRSGTAAGTCLESDERLWDPSPPSHSRTLSPLQVRFLHQTPSRGSKKPKPFRRPNTRESNHLSQ